MSGNNRTGAMGDCTHTNDNHYGRNGCHACDQSLEEWLEQQKQANQQHRETGNSGGGEAREDAGNVNVVDRDC